MQLKQKLEKFYAIKRFLLDKLENEEINNMLFMNKCENSIKYYECFIEDNFIYLTMELCDYNLEQKIK